MLFANKHLTDLEQVVDAKLRGRGGAGRLTGEKWRIVRNMDDDQKYVICNAYDADPRSLAARSCWNAIHTRSSRVFCLLPMR